MKSHWITGGGDVQLHVVETGNPRGRPIVFIHGISQCWLQWSRQLDSDLAEDHRLVALDMRGHGLSDKPRDAYGDSKLWADDVHAVIEALDLEQAVLSGWSYGPLVFLDYIRHYGEDRLGGLQFVAAVTRLGSEEALSVLTPEFIDLFGGLLATVTEKSVRALESLLNLCFVSELPVEERYLMLGFNLSVPPYVRQGLFSRSFDNEDLLPRIRKPVLITHGTLDAIVKPAAVDQHKAAMPHAEVQMMDGVGHAPFREEPAGFNARLRTFCQNL